MFTDFRKGENMKQHTSKQSKDEIMAIMKDYAQKIFSWAERNREEIPKSVISPWLELQIELKEVDMELEELSKEEKK